jgi:hypothetical protein
VAYLGLGSAVPLQPGKLLPRAMSRAMPRVISCFCHVSYRADATCHVVLMPRVMSCLCHVLMRRSPFAAPAGEEADVRHVQSPGHARHHVVPRAVRFSHHASLCSACFPPAPTRCSAGRFRPSSETPLSAAATVASPANSLAAIRRLTTALRMNRNGGADSPQLPVGRAKDQAEGGRRGVARRGAQLRSSALTRPESPAHRIGRRCGSACGRRVSKSAREVVRVPTPPRLARVASGEYPEYPKQHAFFLSSLRSAREVVLVVHGAARGWRETASALWRRML